MSPFSASIAPNSGDEPCFRGLSGGAAERAEGRLTPRSPRPPPAWLCARPPAREGAGRPSGGRLARGAAAAAVRRGAARPWRACAAARGARGGARAGRGGRRAAERERGGSAARRARASGRATAWDGPPLRTAAATRGASATPASRWRRVKPASSCIKCFGVTFVACPRCQMQDAQSCPLCGGKGLVPCPLCNAAAAERVEGAAMSVEERRASVASPWEPPDARGTRDSERPRQVEGAGVADESAVGAVVDAIDSRPEARANALRGERALATAAARGSGPGAKCRPSTAPRSQPP